jgi:hypothetical protein
MPLPEGSAGRGRRPQWPLAAAWAVSVASLLVITLLRRTAAHSSGTFLLAGRAGSLIVVLAYARLPRPGAAAPGRLPVSSGRRAVIARG